MRDIRPGGLLLTCPRPSRPAVPEGLPCCSARLCTGAQPAARGPNQQREALQPPWSLCFSMFRSPAGTGFLPPAPPGTVFRPPILLCAWPCLFTQLGAPGDALALAWLAPLCHLTSLFCFQMGSLLGAWADLGVQCPEGGPHSLGWGGIQEVWVPQCSLQGEARTPGLGGASCLLLATAWDPGPSWESAWGPASCGARAESQTAW